ncbi:hypothetical protein ANCCAN_14326, partial [Ancylostoma caninum]
LFLAVGLANVTSLVAGGSSPEDEYVGWELEYKKFYKTYYYEYEEFTWRVAPKQLRMKRKVAEACKINIPVGQLQVVFCAEYDAKCFLIKPYKDLTAKEKKLIGEKDNR